MLCIVPNFNTKPEKEALNYAKKGFRFCRQLDKMSTFSHKECKDLLTGC